MVFLSYFPVSFSILSPRQKYKQRDSEGRKVFPFSESLYWNLTMNVNIALSFRCLLWQKLNMNNSRAARGTIACEGIRFHNSSVAGTEKNLRAKRAILMEKYRKKL